MNQGEKNGRAKLTEQDVKAVKELLKLGYTQRRIAEMFGVWSSTICYINQGKLWKHLKTNIDHSADCATAVPGSCVCIMLGDKK